MKASTSLLALTAAASLAAGTAHAADAKTRAPEPSHQIDVESFYAGSWKEIARTPMKITDGCVAGETRFEKDDKGKLIDRDSCRVGDPVAGEEKVFAGPVKILNPGSNTKFSTSYKVAKLFSVKREYWVLDSGQNWFIVSNPDFTEAGIFTRTTQPSQATKDQLSGRLKALGFDTAKLEWPAQPPE